MALVQMPYLQGGQALQAGVMLLLAMLVVVSALAVVHAKFESRVLFSELQQLNKVQDKLDVEWSQLQLEQSTWAAHGRVERTARKRLGMVLPEPAHVVVIRP